MTYQKIESHLTPLDAPAELPESDQQDTKNQLVPEQTLQINKTKHSMEEIKTNVLTLIDAFGQKPSLFSQATLYWDKIPFWQKIAAGVGLSAPLILIGMVAHSAVFFMLGWVSALIYTASSMLLDNHREEQQHHSERLKSHINKVTDLMNGVMLSLEEVREQLAADIVSFQKEIGTLKHSIGDLDEQIITLTEDVERLTASEKALRTTVDDLKQTGKALEDTVTEQTELLNKAQKNLDDVIEEYNEKLTKLRNEITQLNTVKGTLSTELDQINILSKILNETVVALSQTVIADSEHRAAFLKRLEAFLNNKEESFDRIVLRICEAEKQLERVTDQLKEANQRHDTLLDVQEQHLVVLEQITEQHVLKAEAHESEVKIKPSVNGFYAANKESSSAFELPTKGSTMIAVM